MSKELEALEMLKSMCKEDERYWEQEYHTIKQALEEKEKQDKILKILKRASKEEYVFTLSPYSCSSRSIEDGSDGYRCMKLTEEEYNLIDEWLEE